MLRHSMLLALAPGLVAQAPVRGQQLVTVTTALADENVTAARCFQNGIAAVPGGELFVLVVRAKKVAGERGESWTSGLELWRSRDGSHGWQRATAMTVRGASDGAIVVDGDHLAVLCSATGDDAFGDVWFQRFDPASSEWVGQPVSLMNGRGEEDQYFCYDLARTASGSLVAAIGSHRSPTLPGWASGWSSGARCLAAGGTEWSALQQANVGYSGVVANVVARGETVEFVYRTIHEDTLLGLRTFDAAGGAFVEAKDVCVIAPEHVGKNANVGVVCLDGSGGRTVLHVSAADMPGHGTLAVSFSRPDGPVTTTTITADPPLLAGNENPGHFSLARGPGEQVFAYFSKVSEEHARLWQVVVEQGKPVVAPKVVVEGAPGQFQGVTGQRASSVFSGLHVATSGHPAEHPTGVVAVFGAWPARTLRAR